MLGGLDERTKLYLKDNMDNELFANRLNDTSAINQPDTPITKRILDLGYTYSGKDRKKLLAIGSQMSKKYKVKHGKAPIKRNQYVDGATRRVNCYFPSDFKMLDSIINKYYTI